MHHFVADAIVLPQTDQLVALGLQCGYAQIGHAHERLRRTGEVLGRRELLQSVAIQVAQE